MRKILTSEQKVEVMKALDSGGSCRDVALKFGVWKIANFQDQDFNAKFIMYVHTSYSDF